MEQSVVKQTLRKAHEQLADGLVERDVPAALLLLAAVAGDHMLLGPPGTAKSQLARRLHGTMSDGKYFERLLTRFSVPEELFGPISINGLQRDEYMRKIQGYLPDATVAFVDEIFKANSAILNALLTILNEREFDNGPQRVKTPLKCLVGASNELPVEDGLEALYDRFLLRYQVEPVSAARFKELLLCNGNGTTNTASLDDNLLNAVGEGVESVRVSDSVLSLLAALREFLEKEEIYVSDRRWRQALRLLKVAAWTNGQDAVTIWECWLLQHCLWREPAQREKIYEWYAARIGALDGARPERMEAVVAAWEKKLSVDAEAMEHRRGDKGNLLFTGPDGKPTVKKRGLWHERDEAGQALFLCPHRDSDSDSRRLTEAGLERWLYSSAERKKYIVDKANWALDERDNPPLMGPRRYSKSHVEGRLEQLAAHEKELNDHVAGLQHEVERLDDLVCSHLWLPDDFVAVARRNADRHLESSRKLQERLSAVREGFSSLPLEDE